VADVAGSQALSDTLVELPDQVFSFDGPELRVSSENELLIVLSSIGASDAG